MESTKGKQITILHTNDIHGRYRAFRVAPGSATSQTGDPGQVWDQFDRDGMVGGFPALATAVRRIREERGNENVILIDGGDTFSDDLLGNLTQGEAVIRLMNQLGYQFMALGNHDFDYGYERTRALDKMANFPMRGANVIEKDTGEPFLGEPFIILETNGIRVGLLALGYPNTGLTGNKKNFEILDFTDGIEATQRYLPDLQRSADVVIVLSHMGTALDRKLAEEVQGIDLIIGGHSHDRIQTERIGSVILSQAVSDASVLGETTIQMSNGQITSVENNLHSLWADEYPEDEEVAAMVVEIRSPYKTCYKKSRGQNTEP